MQRLSSKLALLYGEPTHWCPGCKMLHRIDVSQPNSHTGAKWTWNNDLVNPSFSPSINIVGQCHYFINNGQIQFCGDSKHELAGQTVPLPDLPNEEVEDWV